MATKQETKKPQADASRDGASGGDTLSVTDNRTGESYELEINDGTIKTMDLRQIKVDEDDFGLMGYDPAFTNTASCRSAITYIDGEAGVLQHRGIPIEQLCEDSTYLEVAYLLIFGELPTPAATAEYGSTCEDPTARTAAVEQFCSWSACRIQRTSSARSMRGSGWYLTSVILYIMFRKLPG